MEAGNENGPDFRKSGPSLAERTIPDPQIMYHALRFAVGFSPHKKSIIKLLDTKVHAANLLPAFGCKWLHIFPHSNDT